MLNIVYKGCLEKEKLLITENPRNAVEFKECDSVGGVFVGGGIIALPFLILITLIMIYCIVCQYKEQEGSVISCAVLMGLFGIVMVLFAVQYLHELLHAIFYPRTAKKEIWYTKKGNALFVYCKAHITKKRFIWICLAPNVILGMLPFAIFVCIQGVISIYFFVPAIIISYFTMIMGIGDYYNVYNALCQVPKGGIIYNNGLHSYWYKNGGEYKSDKKKK